MLKALKILSSATAITTTMTAEWVWVAGRVAASFAGILGALSFLDGTRAQGAVLGSASAVLAYNIILAFLLSQGRLAVVFWLGSILDNAALLVSWFAVTQSQVGVDRGVEEYLILFPILAVSAARFGIVLGLFHTSVWLGIFAATTLLYYPPGSYDVLHLPTRMLILMITTALTLFLVTRLSTQGQRIQALAEEAEAQRDAVSRLNDELEQRVDERTKQLTDASLQLEAALEQTAREQAALQSIQKSMSEGLIVLDDRGVVQYLNPAAAALLGIPAQGAPGAPLYALFTDGLEAVYEQLVGIIPPDAQPSSAEAVVIQVGSDGRAHRDLALTGFEVPLGRNQQLAGLLVRDVTKERDLDRQRNAFVSIASHELRTPLTSIIGFGELLIQAGNLSGQQRKWVETMLEAGQGITRIVSELLDISRIHSGTLSISPRPLSVAEVVDEAIAYIAPLAGGHKLSSEVPGGLPEVVADKGKLLQVLVNLLSNGIKYSPDGGPLVMRARSDDRQRIVISVTDHGIGIAEEDAAELFTTFHRIHRPETITIQGVGLGLYIVKRFVEMMKGDIWVESQLNAGSTFYVALPAHVEAENAASLSHEHATR